MAPDNPNLAPWMSWPEPQDIWLERWLGGEYPTGRREPQPVTGWQCPGCGRCWAPQVLACHHCPQVRQPVTEPGPVVRLGHGDPITDDDAER